MKYLVIFIISLTLIGCGTPDYDLFIKNANIIDGSGSTAYQSDIAIKDGIIVEEDS